ncbi:MAG: hypothetical protein KC800_32300, partial [Candidatus Eremiobacteraeota bacterium]|nr:hypothetical protein [Candidatus Eremiobacteraeota bacterium]
ESIPAAVPAFFAKATELTGKYDLSAGDLLLVPQSLMVRSGRVAPKEAERAFQPLKDLLDKHRVSGGEVLDLIVPGILTKTELLLKTPPEKRKDLRGSSPDTSKRRQVISFAQKHNIPLLEMAAALKSLRSL